MSSWFPVWALRLVRAPRMWLRRLKSPHLGRLHSHTGEKNTGPTDLASPRRGLFARRGEVLPSSGQQSAGSPKRAARRSYRTAPPFAENGNDGPIKYALAERCPQHSLDKKASSPYTHWAAAWPALSLPLLGGGLAERERALKRAVMDVFN